MSDTHAVEGHEHSDHGGNAKYLAVFGCLIVLTLISFWLGGSSINQTAPMVAKVGMLAVSCAKALLVMLFFMHLIWEANWKYVLTIPASLMSIFLICMLIPDVGRRTEKYSLRRWTHSSESSVETHESREDHHEESSKATTDDGSAH